MNSLDLFKLNNFFDRMLGDIDYGLSVKDNPEHLELEVEIPGVKKEDVSLFYDKGHLLLDWKRNGMTNKRQWYVGHDYDFNNVIVNLDLGILYLKVPKKLKDDTTKINLLK